MSCKYCGNEVIEGGHLAVCAAYQREAREVCEVHSMQSTVNYEPSDKLKEIENYLESIKHMNSLDRRKISTNHIIYLVNRVRKLEADLRSISWGLECSACSCNCHEIARKALEEE